MLRIITICLWIAVLVLGVRFVRMTVKSASNPSGDFAIYYTASRLLAEGANVSQVYNNIWFNARVHERTPMVGAVNINPPPNDLVLLSIAGLNFWWALRVWTVFNVLLLTLTTYFLVTRLGFKPAWALGFIALVLLWQPVHLNFVKGQFYVLLLALTTALWQAYRSRRNGLVGVTLGTLLLIKLSGGLFLLMFAAERRWRALGWTVALVGAVTVFALPWLRPSAWSASVHAMNAFHATGLMNLTDYQAQSGMLHRLFAYDAGVNPRPLFNVPFIATVLNVLATTALVGFTLFSALRTRNSQGRDMIFAALVAAGLILSPASLEYHYTLLLLPIALLLARAPGEGARWRICLALAIALTALRMPYQSPAFDHGWEIFLAYPRLYAAYLIWGLAISASRRETTQTDGPQRTGVKPLKAAVNLEMVHYGVDA